jgi:hypothetical protein
MLLVNGCPSASTAIKLCMAALKDKPIKLAELIPLLVTTCLIVVTTAEKISSRSCSAAAVVGAYNGYPMAWLQTVSPLSVNRTAFVLVVPISIPMT